MDQKPASFYGSPQEALKAPPEEFLYLACLHEGTGVDTPDLLALVDRRRASPLGWNRCSSACHGPNRSHVIGPRLPLLDARTGQGGAVRVGRSGRACSWARSRGRARAEPTTSNAQRPLSRRCYRNPVRFPGQKGNLPDPERWSVADPGRVRPSQILSNAVSNHGGASCKASSQKGSPPVFWRLR
jgi:hypothetical protein